ncbi:MAG: alanyl-tRNA editing protein, partial [Lachnospiraceae bacterium]|nr:alanyl-tRNA editing protein [Lachnospiraceae bacterium]
METKKLYYDDAYLTSFKEEIRECIEKGDGTYEIVMDSTAFFPEEGGQSPDRGTINGVPVIDVQIRDDIIYHITNEAVPAGTEAVCRIDWDHRFSNMQQHSGEHLFSGIAHNDYGCENVGFHLSDNEVTLDLNKPLKEEEILDIERKVNEAIFKNIESIALYPTKQEACSMEYRSKKEIEGQLRLIVYPGYDTCACCAPHVARTGEIGILKVVSFMNLKGGVRINILCGRRALEDYEIKRKAIDAAGKLLSANQNNLEETTAKLLQEKSELIYELVGV